MSRPQPYDLRIPSASEPGREYHVTRASSGSISHPGCTAFAFGRPCRHLRRAEALTEAPLTALAGDLEELAGDAARHLAELAAKGRGGIHSQRGLVGFAALLAERVASAQRAYVAREEWLVRERVRGRRTDAEREVQAAAVFAKYGGAG